MGISYFVYPVSISVRVHAFIFRFHTDTGSNVLYDEIISSVDLCGDDLGVCPLDLFGVDSPNAYCDIGIGPNETTTDFWRFVFAFSNYRHPICPYDGANYVS